MAAAPTEEKCWRSPEAPWQLGRDFTHSFEFVPNRTSQVGGIEQVGQTRMRARKLSGRPEGKCLISIVGQTQASRSVVTPPLSQPEGSIGQGAPGFLCESVPHATQSLCAQHANNNPVKFTDPTGHKACEDQQCAVFETPRGQLRAAYGGALYALINKILTESGSAGDVLGNVMQSTSGMLFGETYVLGVSQGAGAVARGHFTGIGSLRGDTGFAPGLGDEHWYRTWWGENPNPRSLQLGHFLSAVDIALNDGTFNTALMFTHEQYADTNPTSQVLNALGATLGLDGGTSAADQSAFSAAILADSAGASGARDAALWSILRPSSLGSLAARQGNSIEDLRLNVRAYELVAALRSGALTTNQDLGIWIAGNIGVSR